MRHREKFLRGTAIAVLLLLIFAITAAGCSESPEIAGQDGDSASPAEAQPGDVVILYFNYIDEGSYADAFAMAVDPDTLEPFSQDYNDRVTEILIDEYGEQGEALENDLSINNVTIHDSAELKSYTSAQIAEIESVAVVNYTMTEYTLHISDGNPVFKDGYAVLLQMDGEWKILEGQYITRGIVHPGYAPLGVFT
jgi:hypothetical protein